MPASIEALTFRATVSFCDCSVPRPALVDYTLQPGDFAFIVSAWPSIIERLELEVRVGIHQAGDDRDVSQIQITLALAWHGPTQAIRPRSIVNDASSIGGPSTGRT